jgi:hypothetical protein
MYPHIDKTKSLVSRTEVVEVHKNIKHPKRNKSYVETFEPPNDHYHRQSEQKTRRGRHSPTATGLSLY